MIRFPNITGATPEEQLTQLKGYLHQLVEQLNITLENMETDVSQRVNVNPAAAKAAEEKKAQDNFSSIKSLIIKSADIVSSYTEVIQKRLEGVYVAQSEFGTYTEETENLITANSKEISSQLKSIQTIQGTLAETQAHIIVGLLEEVNGLPVYGVEIGQNVTVDGEAMFNKYARFTSDRLSFYDQNGTEMAYISDYTLHITNAEIPIIRQGGFKSYAYEDGSVVEKWVGLEG